MLICEKCAYDMIMWLMYKWYGYDVIIETYVIMWYLELYDEIMLVWQMWIDVQLVAYEKWWISEIWYEVNMFYGCQ